MTPATGGEVAVVVLGICQIEHMFGTVAGWRPTPSCTATPTSRSSTGPATPRSWPRKRPGSGSPALAVTDHDGFYGVVRFAARRPRRSACPRSSARSSRSAIAAAPPNGDRRSAEGEHLARPRRGPGRVRPPRAGDQRGAARGGEGRAPHRRSPSSPPPRARPCTSTATAASAANDSLVRAHRLPQGHGAGGAACATARPRRGVRSTGSSPRSGATVCSSSCGTTATRSTATATTRSPTVAAAAGVDVVATNNVHYATPAQRPLATALAAVRAAPFARRDRRLAPRRAVRAPAQRRPSRPGASRAGRARSSARVEIARACAFDLRLAAPELPDHDGARRSHRDDAGCASSPRAARRSRYPPTHPQHEQAMRQIAYELDVIEQLGFPGYFLRARRHRRVLPRSRHLLPGPGERGEQRGLLRARRHQGRRGRARPAVRAVPLARARRSARHRPRHRAPAPRGGDPVRLRQVRPRPRRAGGERHHLPAALGAAGDGEGGRPLTRARRRAHQVDRPVGPRRHGAFDELASSERRAARPRARARPRRAGARLPAPPRHPLGRDGDGRPSARRVLPDRVGAHGGPLGAPVGQGRLRGGRAGEVRPARPRACSRCCTSRSTSSASTRASRSTSPPSRRSPRSTTLLCAADTIGVFQVESRAQMATLPRLRPRELLRPRGGGRAHPARPDPGRLGAPVPPAAQRRGAGHLPAPAARAVPEEDARRAAVPGAAHADGDRRRRVHARASPTSCARRWARSARRRAWPRCASGCSRAWPSAASPATSPRRSCTSSRRSPTSASPRATR